MSARSAVPGSHLPSAHRPSAHGRGGAGPRRRRIQLGTAAALAAAGALIAPSAPATAATTTAATATATTTSGATASTVSTSTIGTNAVYIASQQAGDPYVWGAAGPDAFDCSGLTKYVYGKLGKYLPHKSSYQVGYTYRVYTPALGDLVFFRNSYGTVYHVGIYAGSGYMWHAPHTGDVVRKAKIYSTSVFYGRVK